MLNGYDLIFHHEQADFVPNPSFVPFFWRRKANDLGNEGAGQDKEGCEGPSRHTGSLGVNMD
jgi:hypothetical protein